MDQRVFIALCGCLLAICCRPTMAHYLWVSADKDAGGEHIANIYFEESPSPGDGYYLDHFLGTSDVWVRTLEDPTPDAIKAVEVKKEDDRWMKVPLAASEDRSVDAYGKFGVYDYSGTKVLLHYYARHLDASSHDALHELGRAEQMRCDLVPHDHGEAVEVTLLWKGEPVADRMVFVRGPGRFRRNVKTDSRGQVSITPKRPGRYTFRSSVEEPIAGEEGGDAYELIRHNVTLVMRLPLGS